MEPTRSDGRAARAELETGVVRGCEVETTAIRSFLSALGRPRLGWADETTTIAAGGAATTVTATGSGRYTVIRERAREVFEKLQAVDALPAYARPRMFGGFAFTDTHDPTPGQTWEGYPGAEFVLPAVQLSVTPEGTWLTTTAVGPGATEDATTRLEAWRKRLATLPELESASAPGIRGLSYNPSREIWREQVTSAVERIRQESLEKVVLAQSLTATLEKPVTATDVLARLAEPYPDCYRFLFEPREGGTFFGATPERLVSVQGDTVETEALAGSIRRGSTPEEDEELANELRESEKDDHEHTLVVDAIRDQLQGLAADIQTGDRTVRRLANVQHLQTPMRAMLDGDEHVLSLVEALHPTPAVGGLPPDEALQTISESEAFERGWYAAPVGWIDSDGNGTFAVAIRSGIAEGRTMTMFAGAGIVADSDPDREWDELQLKYEPILDELS